MTRIPIGRLRQVASQEEAERLGDLAIRKGWLAPGQATTKEDLRRLLLDRYETLVAELRREEFRRVIQGRLIQVPAEARTPAETLDEFALVKEVGRGGEAEVWKAWDRDLARWVAIKRPTGEHGERFYREALTAAGLSHPNIVPIHRVAGTEAHPYLVMQLVEGHSLHNIKVAPAIAAELMRKIAGAVAYAHGRGVVHRDLKPGNIMVDERGEPRILDFGIAHLGSAPESGQISGTVEFMAPEQATGGPEANHPAVDIYALGSTLKAITATPSALDFIVIKAMSRDPKDRYPTAEAFAADLAKFETASLRRYIWLLPVAAACLLAVTAFFFRGDSIAGRLKNAQHLLEIGSTKPALDEFAAVLKRDATSADAWAGQGAAHRALQDWGAAETDFVTALRLRPDPAWRAQLAETLGGWADSVSKAGDDPVSLFDRAERAAAESGDPRWRAEIHRLKGDHDLRIGTDPHAAYKAAEEEFEKALAKNAADPAVWRSRGTLRYNLGDYQANHGNDPLPHYASAAADYSEALRRAPADGPSLFFRGCIRWNVGCHLRKSGKPDEARARFKEAADDFEKAAKDPALTDKAEGFLTKAKAFAEE